MNCCQHKLYQDWGIFSPPGVVAHDCLGDHGGATPTHNVVQTSINSATVNQDLSNALDVYRQLTEKAVESITSALADGVIFAGVSIRPLELEDPQTGNLFNVFRLTLKGLKPV